MTENILFISTEEPIKRPKGRPLKIFTAEEIEERKPKGITGKPGRIAKIYTQDEILTKLEHFREYQRNYQKGKYVKKSKNTNILNYSCFKKYKIQDDQLIKPNNIE
jgi:hypothetical protein